MAGGRWQRFFQMCIPVISLLINRKRPLQRGTAVTLHPTGRFDHLIYSKKDRQWYLSPNARQVAENILSWQSDLGSWPKNLDTTKEPFAADRKSLKGTFDNGATVGEVRFLARIFTITKDSRFHDSFLKGL